MPLASVLRQSSSTWLTFGCLSCTANISRIGLKSGLMSVIGGGSGKAQIQTWTFSSLFKQEPRPARGVFGGQHLIALLPAHMGHVDDRHGIVGQDFEHGPRPRPLQRPAREERGQRTFESAQVERRLA